MQGKISHGGRCRHFWVIVQHQPDRARGGHCGQEDGPIFDTDIRRLDSHHHRCWTSDDTARGQQYCQGCRLSGCHRQWSRDGLRCHHLPDPGIHPSHPDCSCHGPLRVLTQLWIRESPFRRFSFSFAQHNQRPAQFRSGVSLPAVPSFRMS
jgi:hypothetical protein